MRVIYFIIILIPCALIAQTIDYFPAHIGDTYEYETTYYESNQKTYYKTIITNIVTKIDGGIDIYFDNSTQPRYYKAMNGNVYQYADNKPYLWYDFTTASLDTFYTKLSGMELYVVVYHGGASLFGKNINARSFTFYSINSHSANGHHWLGDGLGIIEMDSYIYPPDNNKLVGCIIDGKGYGTLVSVEAEHTITRYELYQNYPNPFNPSTVIKYEIPEPSHVSLIIYNVLGIQIEMLLDEYQNSGIHSVIFNARKYSSGVYFYMLKTNNHQQTKKLLLIK